LVGKLDWLKPHMEGCHIAVGSDIRVG
jgi:hypothetical protein